MFINPLVVECPNLENQIRDTWRGTRELKTKHSVKVKNRAALGFHGWNRTCVKRNKLASNNSRAIWGTWNPTVARRITCRVARAVHPSVIPRRSSTVWGIKTTIETNEERRRVNRPSCPTPRLLSSLLSPPVSSDMTREPSFSPVGGCARIGACAWMDSARVEHARGLADVGTRSWTC